MQVISGSSNIPLTKKLAEKLSVTSLDTELTSFANGERRIWIKSDEAVRGQNICLVQSFSEPVDTHIMECLLMVDALERMGARHINLIIPWLGYSFQDKVFRDGEPIAAKVVANLISNSYVKRVFLLDVHNTSIPGFFSIPTAHLSALGLFVEYVQSTFDFSQAVVASPDFGGLKRSRVFANKLGLELINIDKQRNLKTGEVTTSAVQGDVEGKIVLIFDDAILSGGTAVKASEILKNHGAQEVHFLATHGIFCDNALQKISDSTLDSVIIANSIHHPNLPEKVKVIDVSSLFSNELQDWI